MNEHSETPTAEPRCAYVYPTARGKCGCTKADLLHAVPGSEDYNRLTPRQRALLAEIGGVHDYQSE